MFEKCDSCPYPVFCYRVGTCARTLGRLPLIRNIQKPASESTVLFPGSEDGCTQAEFEAWITRYNLQVREQSHGTVMISRNGLNIGICLTDTSGLVRFVRNE